MYHHALLLLSQVRASNPWKRFSSLMDDDEEEEEGVMGGEVQASYGARCDEGLSS